MVSLIEVLMRLLICIKFEDVKRIMKHNTFEWYGYTLRQYINHFRIKNIMSNKLKLKDIILETTETNNIIVVRNGFDSLNNAKELIECLPLKYDPIKNTMY